MMTQNEFILKFLRMIANLSSRTNAPHTFSCGLSLYTAETHIIELIGENGCLTSKEITEQLGTTKGATSQIIKKLEEKELILRDTDNKRGGQIPLVLTEVGRSVYAEHHALHIRLLEELYQTLDGYPTDERAAIEHFLIDEENMIARLSGKCKES